MDGWSVDLAAPITKSDHSRSASTSKRIRYADSRRRAGKFLHLVLLMLLPFIGALLTLIAGRAHRNMLAGIACAPAMVGLVLLALLAPAVLGASRPVASGDAIRTSPLYPVALVLLLLARFWPVLAGEDLSFYLVSTTGPGPRARHWRCTG